MNGTSIYRRRERALGGPATGRTRALLAIPVALGAIATLTIAGCAATSPQAGAGDQTGLSAAASTGHPGQASGASASGLAPPSATTVTGTWRKLPAAPIGKPPTHAVAVWTGSKMIIYGTRVTPSGIDRFNVAYLPAYGTWQQLARGPRPDPDNDVNGGNVVAWTGSQMLVLGITAAAYNPAANTWRPLATGGPGPTDGAVSGWTGTQELVWGGVCCAPSNSGMAYDLAANAWSRLPASPLAPRAFPAGAWTGSELVVAGGSARTTGGTTKVFRSGAAYNPATGTWRRLPPMPHPRYGAQALWDGKEVLFLGGHRAPGTSPATSGMAYNPATGTWRNLPAMQYGRDKFTAVWTGRRVLVWGGATGREDTVLPPHGEAFNPATGTWTALPKAPLAGRESPVSVWTGHRMIIWGGEFATPYIDGASFTPRTP
jgi:hypothetical protein